MTPKAFSTPQRQSVLGVALIFSTTLYRFLRGFWVLGVYFLLSDPSASTILYVTLGILALGIIVLVYSWLYFRKFLFHIDYHKEEFVLQKGVLSTEDLAIPFDKIQQVYLKRSILQRIINVYSVVIETAGSKEDEVNIKALSGSDANLLTNILIKAKREAAPVSEDDQIPASSGQMQEKRELWIHKLDVLTLLKIGLSTNYVRGLALVLAFFATIYNELNSVFRDYKDEFTEYYERVPNLSGSVSVIVIVFVLLLIVSILITVLEVFIKYYGLKLVQTPQSLELEMGLKTNTKVSLQPRRVQLMQIVTNPVQKRFDLYEARIALASSENTLQKKKIKIPGLGKDTVGKVESYLYGNFETNFEQKFRPHRLMLIRRLFIVFIPVLISYLVLLRIPYIEFNIWAILAACFIVLGVIYQILSYRSQQLIFTEEFLQKKQGVWNKKEELFEVFKMQSVTVKQPFWYRRRNLINVMFHTAGGDVSFRAVNRDILTYINYVLYKAESTGRKWM
ncbi:PH domain-containing protein [Antarcticibacterium sp. 1MA-6-2]|uniref:PH domain-containing protein n=1 Tax=Antarcticibacterium sp. 1MA-6-2 TaxID=2908210 RepID=UPI001F300F5B|nr:PH domain-containing protein [Antarcticibacterium sp. 1MA-6-2]UJH91263.1 PH domain-containing protein [Antarcticibacterium sp. 1MA-6-2]